MCGEPIADAHQHVVDLEQPRPDVHLPGVLPAVHRRGRRAALPRRARAVPVVPDFGLGPAQWDELEIPVGLAFFFCNSMLGRTVAFYPGPAGATESELLARAPGTPSSRRTRSSPLLAPDVEALLIRAPERGRRRLRLPPGADRRLLRAGRPAPHACGVGSTAGRTPTRRSMRSSTTVSRRSRPGHAAAVEGRRHEPTSRSPSPTSSPSRTRRAAAHARSCGSRRSTGSADPRDRAALPGPDRAAAARATQRPRSDGLIDSSDPRPWSTTLKPFLWMQCRDDGRRASPASPRSMSRCRARTTSR